MLRRRNITRPWVAVAPARDFAKPRENDDTPLACYISPAAALVLLLTVRLLSAASNIIHDCDEVFNYWEPLHYLLYGYGLQTWEYSSAYALRSWWYLLIHAAVGAPVARLVGPQKGKLVVFYLIRAALGALSALTESWLYSAVMRQFSPALAAAFLVLLCTSSGLFVAATALLPSSFTMYFVTAAAAGTLSNKPCAVIWSAVVGILWGWCVAGIAYLPYAAWILAHSVHAAPNWKPFVSHVKTLVIAMLCTLAPLIVADRLYYGSWKASLWNFLAYNVAGGGKSALYGVEGPWYYLRNGANQLQLVLLLALALPVLGAGAVLLRFPREVRNIPGPDFGLGAAVASFYLWLLAVSALPHKEERFLYVVYPLACLAAASALELLSRFVRGALPRRFGAALAQTGFAAALVVSTLLSVSRAAALVSHYGAPMHVYLALPALPPKSSSASGGEVSVCVGAEWHRYPSSFFLPGPSYRLRFLKSGFSGLLPRAFDPVAGGTRAAPPQLNDQNLGEPDNYWTSAERCAYVVTLSEGGLDDRWSDDAALGKAEDWEVAAEAKFLDAAASPPLTRAFYVPWVSARRNMWLRYALLRRRQQDGLPA